jgi:hypothetical protein
MSQIGRARIQAVKSIRCRPPKSQRYLRAVGNLRTSSYGAVLMQVTLVSDADFLPANFWTTCPEKPAKGHSRQKQHRPAGSPPPAGQAPDCHFRTFCPEIRTVGEAEQEIGRYFSSQGWASCPSLNFASRSSHPEVVLSAGQFRWYVIPARKRRWSSRCISWLSREGCGAGPVSREPTRVAGNLESNGLDVQMDLEPTVGAAAAIKADEPAPRPGLAAARSLSPRHFIQQTRFRCRLRSISASNRSATG